MKNVSIKSLLLAIMILLTLNLCVTSMKAQTDDTPMKAPPFRCVGVDAVLVPDEVKPRKYNVVVFRSFEDGTVQNKVAFNPEAEFNWPGSR
jgi:hypothetical protein